MIHMSNMSNTIFTARRPHDQSGGRIVTNLRLADDIIRLAISE